MILEALAVTASGSTPATPIAEDEGQPDAGRRPGARNRPSTSKDSDITSDKTKHSDAFAVQVQVGAA